MTFNRHLEIVTTVFLLGACISSCSARGAAATNWPGSLTGTCYSTLDVYLKQVIGENYKSDDNIVVSPVENETQLIT